MSRYSEDSEYLLRVSDGDLDVGLFHEAGSGIDGFAFRKHRSDGIKLLCFSLIPLRGNRIGIVQVINHGTIEIPKYKIARSASFSSSIYWRLLSRLQKQLQMECVSSFYCLNSALLRQIQAVSQLDGRAYDARRMTAVL